MIKVNKTWNKASNNKYVWHKLLECQKKKIESTKEKDVNLWESINFNSFYEISRKEKWTTLNELVLRLTPYKTIPGLYFML